MPPHPTRPASPASRLPLLEPVLAQAATALLRASLLGPSAPPRPSGRPFSLSTDLPAPGPWRFPGTGHLLAKLRPDLSLNGRLVYSPKRAEIGSPTCLQHTRRLSGCLHPPPNRPLLFLFFFPVSVWRQSCLKLLIVLPQPPKLLGAFSVLFLVPPPKTGFHCVALAVLELAL